MTPLLINQQAPEFSIADQEGNIRTLADHAGQWLFIYFYLKDMSPGCTLESQELRDMYEKFKEYDCEIIGVSKDDAKSHQKFIEKESLPFNLLADTEFEMLKSYDVWREKNMFGKKYKVNGETRESAQGYMGIVRTSFLINPDGNIHKIYDKVKPAGHAESVFIDLQHAQEEKVSA